MRCCGRTGRSAAALFSRSRCSNPHLAAAVVLLLIVKHQWRALAGFATIGVPLMTLPPLLLSGPRLFFDQIGLLLSYTNSATEHRVAAESMVNIRGPVTALAGSSNPWLWLPLLVLIATAATFVAFRVWRHQPPLHPQRLGTRVRVAAALLPTRALSDGGAAVRGRWPLSRRRPIQSKSPHQNRAHSARVRDGQRALASGDRGTPLMAVYIMAAYTIVATRWPAAAAQAVEQPEQEPALAA